MRCSFPILVLLISILTTGCVFDRDSGSGLFGKDSPGRAEEKRTRTDDGKAFSRIGNWLGRGKKDDEDGAGNKPVGGNPVPIPQKMPIGSVHLVHKAAGFVLIRTSRTTEVDPAAEMATYDQGGRPTGKLRLSPERKGGFLVADIVDGNPQANDRVIMFGYIDQEGSFQFDSSDPEQVEVLE